MRTFLALAILVTTAVGAVAMPAHPDLLQRLGPQRVAALQRAGLDAEGGWPALIAPLRRDAAGRGAPTRGTGTCLLLLWQWPDHPADAGAHPASAYEDLIFSAGTHPTGSMNDFWAAASFGAFQVAGTVLDWTTATATYASYAHGDGSQDPTTCREMIRDAIAQLDPTVDFAQWDNDGPDGVPHSGDDDGFVDALFFLHAGAGQEASGDVRDIWSHASYFWDLVTDDGVAIGRYSVEPEEMPDGTLVTVGVYCHEYGHVLGLPDLYDVDYSSSGVGEWCLMSGGSWNHRPGEPAGSCPALPTAWCKAQLHWIEPLTIGGDVHNRVIPPAALTPVAYRIDPRGLAGGPEYFLLENRQPVGFDAGLVRRQVLYGLDQPRGLAIYHVDESCGGNANERRRLLDVEDASPWLWGGSGEVCENLDGAVVAELRRYLWAYNRGDNGDVWPGFTACNGDSTDWVAPRDRDRFADDTVPAAWDHGCEPTGIAVENIRVIDDLVVCDVTLATPGLDVDPVPAPVVWDFEEGGLGDFRACDGFAHLDRSLAGDCPGAGGVWFGTDGWANCGGIGYGNDWNDALSVTLLVGLEDDPEIRLTHRHEVEEGFDAVIVEVRATGTAAWTQLAWLTGYTGCREDAWPIPADVLAAGEVGGAHAMVDLRLRLVSDGGWSAEDGWECGIGWWVDRLEVTGAPVAADELPSVAAAAAALLPAAPNPFNPSTVIRCHVPEGAPFARLRVFDAAGRAVRTLLAGEVLAGWHDVPWDGRDDRGARVPSGSYVARFEAGGQVRAQKLALLK